MALILQKNTYMLSFDSPKDPGTIEKYSTLFLIVYVKYFYVFEMT